MSDENARTMANFAEEAARVGLAIVFPDSNPRGSIFQHRYERV